MVKSNFESASSRPPNLHRDRGNAGIFAPAFSGSVLDIAAGRFRNKGTDPEDTVEMMLTSTLPLAGQRQRAPTQEHGED